MEKRGLPWWFWATMIFVVLMGLILIAAHKKEEKEKQREEAVYDYFWIDDSQCLHKTNCLMLRLGPLEDDKEVSRKVHFVKKEELNNKKWQWYCPSCIDVEDFKKIQTIIKDSQ